jgi:serine/threonine protein kinase
MSIAGLPEEPLLPDAQGAKVLEYTLGKIIGRGGFSTVRQATHSKTGEVLACKIVKRDDLSDQSGSLEGFEDEIRIWQALPEHPALLPLIEMHRTPYATFLFMPLLAGGSLLEVLRHEGGSDKTARKWFPGVVSAVAALQEGYETFGGNMLHGDLKLDNFMVDTAGGIRLGDFGMAKMLTEAETLSVPGPGFKSGLPPHMGGRQRLSSAPSPNPRSRGRQMSRSPNRRRETFTAAELTPNPASPMPSASLPYAPPELLCAPPAPASLKQDIWALGVILYALLTGRLPFTDSFDPRLQMKILRGQYDPLPPHMGHEWLEVLHGCLERDLHARWDIQRVRTSDAVTGWREVKPKAGSRSRSRVRLAPDSPGIDGIPLAGRGRDRSRSRLRTTPGHAHSHSGSISGSGHGSLAHAPLAAHHRHGSYTDTPSPGLDERDGGFFRSRHGLESRSRSASSTCQRQRPISGAGAGDVHMLGTGTDERLIAALDEVAISRGRRGRRDDDRMDSTGPGTPRDGSASSLHVRDGRQERARSRTRLDGVQVPVPGSGPPSARERHHWSHVQHERTYAHVQPDQQGNIHNPTPMQDHNAGHPHGLVHGHSHNHGHGHQNGVIAEPEDPHTPGRWRAPDAHAQSRPPTLGIVLDAVDEEGRGRRGRGHGHEGGGFGTGYGHDHGPAPGARSRSLRRME